MTAFPPFTAVQKRSLVHLAAFLDGLQDVTPNSDK